MLLLVIATFLQNLLNVFRSCTTYITRFKISREHHAYVEHTCTYINSNRNFWHVQSNTHIYVYNIYTNLGLVGWLVDGSTIHAIHAVFSAKFTTISFKWNANCSDYWAEFETIYIVGNVSMLRDTLNPI